MANPGDIIITEIMYNPAVVADSLGEYFEIYNRSNAPIDLAGWTLTDQSLDSHIITGQLIIPAGGFLVLGRSSEFASNGGVVVSYVYGNYNLTNSADAISLKDAGGVLIDSVAYNVAAGWPSGNGQSLELNSNFFDATLNDFASSWALATPFYGAGDRGTPGAQNQNQNAFVSVPTAGDDFLVGSGAGDPIDGGAGNDTIFGQGGEDALSGGADNDALLGVTGNDFLTGGAGNDSLNGGADFDYANYLDTSTTAGITLSLAITTAQNTGGAGIDTLTVIEGIYGSNFGDTLAGDNAAVNALYGWGGADLLSGNGGFDYVEAGEGDDTMEGGTGDDYLLGGNGIDTLTYASAGAAVYVDMSGASAFANGTASGFDVLSGVERVIGSDFGDFLFGSAGADTLVGDLGIDIIYGFGLGDSLDGGGDTDYLVGGAGADTITTGAGQDYIYFQAQNEGKDTVTDWRVSGFDILCIDEPAFGAGLTVNQYLSDSGNANRFVVGTVATAAIGQFLWNSATSTLYWDADGTGGGAAVQLVTLTGITTLTAGDILVL